MWPRMRQRSWLVLTEPWIAQCLLNHDSSLPSAKSSFLKTLAAILMRKLFLVVKGEMNTFILCFVWFFCKELCLFFYIFQPRCCLWRTTETTKRKWIDKEEGRERVWQVVNETQRPSHPHKHFQKIFTPPSNKVLERHMWRLLLLVYFLECLVFLDISVKGRCTFYILKIYKLVRTTVKTTNLAVTAVSFVSYKLDLTNLNFTSPALRNLMLRGSVWMTALVL